MSTLLEFVTSKPFRARLDELKRERPDVETLSYMLGPVRFLEWAHSIGVVTDERLRSLVQPLPPFKLRSIAGGWSESLYLWTGLDNAAKFHGILREHLRPPMKVLDFGCGSGRLLRFMARIHNVDIAGSEINPALAEWCRVSLGVDVRTNGSLPPLQYEDASFDAVYGLSVFTHLPLAASSQWLVEVARVLKSEGIAILTTQGHRTLSNIQIADHLQRSFEMSAERAAELDRRLDAEGFIYERLGESTIARAKAGEDYGNAFITERYIRAEWSRGPFEVVNYLTEEIRRAQNVVVLKRK